MADEAAHKSAERQDEEVLLGCFLGTTIVASWDLLATTAAARDCCIESRVPLSSAYFQIELEYRKPASAGTADIAFSKTLTYPTVQSEVRRAISCAFFNLRGQKPMIK